MLFLNHWHLLETWHSGGFCRARCVFCTHFGREKVHFWGCPDRPLLQDTSIINVTWQCRNVEFGAEVMGMPASGRLSHKGHRGKDKNLSLHTCFEFNPGFSSHRCRKLIRVRLDFNGLYKKRCDISWVSQRVTFCVAPANHSCSRPQTHTEYAGKCAWFLGLTGRGLAHRLWNGSQSSRCLCFRAQISPQPLPPSQIF
jgi:hypothetical protein